jgi:hypothetical protein
MQQTPRWSISDSSGAKEPDFLQSAHVEVTTRTPNKRNRERHQEMYRIPKTHEGLQSRIASYRAAM